MFNKCTCSWFSLVKTIAAVIVLLGSTPANALNLVGLSPIEDIVEVGSDFTLDLMMDFDDVTVGGGVEITYSSDLTFLSFTFDPGFTANFGLLSPAPGETVLPLEIAFGWLIFTGIGGETGKYTVGQLTFHAAGVGPAAIVTTAVSSSLAGPYYGPANPSVPLAVEFGSATLTIVPESKTAFLLGLGFIGLAWMGRVRESYTNPLV